MGLEDRPLKDEPFRREKEKKEERSGSEVKRGVVMGRGEKEG